MVRASTVQYLHNRLFHFRPVILIVINCSLFLVSPDVRAFSRAAPTAVGVGMPGAAMISQLDPSRMTPYAGTCQI